MQLNNACYLAMSRQVTNRIVRPILSKTPEEAKKGIFYVQMLLIRMLNIG